MLSGRASHTCCFLHPTNLIAKALLKQFDTKKQNQGAFKRQEVSESNRLDEHVSATNTISGDAEDGEDDTDGLVDMMDEMDPTEQAAHEECICPVKSVLTKVRFYYVLTYFIHPIHLQLHTLAFKIINSTMILLPAWHENLEHLNLQCHNMPRDIQTHWNSTFNMLAFALEYHKAVESMT